MSQIDLGLHEAKLGCCQDDSITRHTPVSLVVREVAWWA